MSLGMQELEKEKQEEKRADSKPKEREFRKTGKTVIIETIGAMAFSGSFFKITGARAGMEDLEQDASTTADVLRYVFSDEELDRFFEKRFPRSVRMNEAYRHQPDDKVFIIHHDGAKPIDERDLRIFALEIVSGDMRA